VSVCPVRCRYRRQALLAATSACLCRRVLGGDGPRRAPGLWTAIGAEARFTTVIFRASLMTRGSFGLTYYGIAGRGLCRILRVIPNRRFYRGRLRQNGGHVRAGWLGARFASRERCYNLVIVPAGSCPRIFCEPAGGGTGSLTLCLRAAATRAILIVACGLGPIPLGVALSCCAAHRLWCSMVGVPGWSSGALMWRLSCLARF